MANPSSDYIDYICSLYNSSYDDRIENTAPPTAGGDNRTPGDDWMPGVPANHKSLISFQRELAEQGIRLSTSKIKKILITGGLWTTQQTRTIQEMFRLYTSSLEDGGEGMDPASAIKRIADELEISTVSVSVSLPYSSVVYNLENRSSNAKRCARYKLRRDAAIFALDEKRKKAVKELLGSNDADWKERLWRCVVAYEGVEYHTSGRGSRPGVAFSYTVSRTADQRSGGRRYGGASVDGYGNELWIKTADGEKKKSISRSTVELGYKRAVEAGGAVKGPKGLGLPGAGSYVYSMLREFGVIKE